MIYLLDTDHLSEVVRESVPGQRLEMKLADLDEFDQVASSIVTFEEMLRGWLAEIHGTKKGQIASPFVRKAV